jgi:hypothetical protein
VDNGIKEQGLKSGYESIISVLAAGALAAVITFFIIQKKKLKSRL